MPRAGPSATVEGRWSREGYPLQTIEASSREVVVASAGEVRDRWSAFLRMVHATGRPVLVTHLKRPMAAMVSLADLELLESRERVEGRRRASIPRWDDSLRPAR